MKTLNILLLTLFMSFAVQSFASNLKDFFPSSGGGSASCTNAGNTYTEGGVHNGTGLATAFCKQTNIDSSGIYSETNINENKICDRTNGAACQNGSCSNTTPNTIYLFRSETTTNGTLGNGTTGRSGADNHCATEADSRHISYCKGAVRGFISIDSSDEIRDMWTNYFNSDAGGSSTGFPIYGLDGGVETVKIADNMSDILDGSIDNTIQAAVGTLTGDYANGYWTFSTSSGAASNTCNGGTSASNGVGGRLGNYTSTSSTWIYDQYGACNFTHEILCACVGYR